VKPAPAMLAELMVTAAVPVEVRVTVWVTGLPMVTDPKARVEGATASVEVRARSASLGPDPHPMTPTDRRQMAVSREAVSPEQLLAPNILIGILIWRLLALK
jgi:hypothetical protein